MWRPHPFTRLREADEVTPGVEGGVVIDLRSGEPVVRLSDTEEREPRT
jgi:hypothetical protein